MTVKYIGETFWFNCARGPYSAKPIRRHRDFGYFECSTYGEDGAPWGMEILHYQALDWAAYEPRQHHTTVNQFKGRCPERKHEEAAS